MASISALCLGRFHNSLDIRPAAEPLGSRHGLRSPLIWCAPIKEPLRPAREGIMSNPWNGKAVLEAFWWNVDDANYHYDWYTCLAKMAPQLAALGFDGIWTPPPCKDSNALNNMGYTPFDYYDLGQKNQNGAVGTRFGTMDAFLRMIAVAHANGLEVYPDIVLDHCGGGANDPSTPFGYPSNYTDFHPLGFAGTGTGAGRETGSIST